MIFLYPAQLSKLFTNALKLSGRYTANCWAALTLFQAYLNLSSKLILWESKFNSKTSKNNHFKPFTKTICNKVDANGIHQRNLLKITRFNGSGCFP